MKWEDLLASICPACRASVPSGQMSHHIERECPGFIRCTSFKEDIVSRPGRPNATDWRPTWGGDGVGILEKRRPVASSLIPDKPHVLITGGTGTFGHAFVQRIAVLDLFSRVTIYSRDEYKQGVMRAEFNGEPWLRFFLGDVRDVDRLTRAMQEIDIVIHAAALKQVDRSFDAFDEFVRTNTVGAMNVVEACHRAGVKFCVALSTDKAVEPTTPYGTSKQAAEWLFVAGNAWGPCKFSLVRYGNIIGSRGSVLDVWRKQLKDYGHIRVTDKAMSRFWLTIDQAVDLVLLALERGRGGEIFIPKDVPRSSVEELAQLNFPNTPIRYTGKRSYEKLTERLVAVEETDRVRDCDDVLVVVPHSYHWEPGPYGLDFPPVPADFHYTSADPLWRVHDEQ